MIDIAGVQQRHPSALDRYSDTMVELAVHLKIAEYPMEFATIRELVTAIVVHASPSRPGGAGPEAKPRLCGSIKGRLAAFCDYPALYPHMGYVG